MENINDKNQIKNILIAVVLIALIAGVMFYSKRKAGEEVIVGDEVETPADNDVLEGDTDTTVAPPTEDIKAQQAIVEANKVKFNTALTNSSNALNARDYDKAISYLKEALKYRETDLVYVRLFTAYGAKGDVVNAQASIDKAIKINPSFTDYWVSKLEYLDQKTSTSYADLKKIYEEGLTKVDARMKVNLVTSFTVIAENNKDIPFAISLWEKAKELFPENKAIYETEINRLKAL